MRMSWHQRRLLQAGWDVISWVIAIPLAVWLRYDLNPPAGLEPEVLIAGGLAALAQLIIGGIARLYRGRYVVGSFDEVFGMVLGSLVIGAIGTVALLVLPPSTFPRTAFILGAGIATTSMLGARFIWRGLQRRVALKRQGRRTVIYGAGDAGSQVVQLLLADRNGDSQPIGFIDDDPSKQHLRRSGIRVLGTLNDLDALIEKEGVQVVLVAIAGISSDRLLAVDRICRGHGVALRVIPTVSEITDGAVRLGDISDVTEEDLMGRRPIQTDEVAITDFIRGKRVLVTGAGGSIGSELARQLLRYEPHQLTLLDRDESALHSTQLTLDGTGDLTSNSLVLADIRDQRALDTIFAAHRPEIVFHAAALKHLTMLERFPSEAFKTNVLGTRNVLDCSLRHGVDIFVNVSTDKAADPKNILGYSKLITERLTASAPAPKDARYMSVRFGNVLGSRGSVIETFRFQISQGGPLTVTDKNVTRYFMTIPEAVHLILQAAVIGESGETLILDMGEPVKISDIAHYMVERSGRKIEIVYTGLRPGEKLEETLVSRTEVFTEPKHPLISQTRVRKLNTHLNEDSLDDEQSRQLLRDVACQD